MATSLVFIEFMQNTGKVENLDLYLKTHPNFFQIRLKKLHIRFKEAKKEYNPVTVILDCCPLSQFGTAKYHYIDVVFPMKQFCTFTDPSTFLPITTWPLEEFSSTLFTSDAVESAWALFELQYNESGARIM